MLHEEAMSERLKQHLRTEWPAESVEEAVLASLNRFDGHQLVKLCWAHAVAGVRSPAYFTHLAEALYAQLSHLSISDMATLLWSFSRLRIHHHELFAGLTEFIWEALDVAGPEDLRLVAEAFAAVDHYDDDQDLFDGIAQAVIVSISSFEPWQLCSVLWSFARLRHYNSMLQEICMETLLPQVKALDMRSLSQLVAAYARLGYDLPLPTLNILGDRAMTFLSDYQLSPAPPGSTPDLALLVWGFAVMGYDTRVLWDTARRCWSHQPLDGLAAEDLARLYFTHLKVGRWVCEMRRSAPKSPHLALLPPHLLPDCFASWQISMLSVPKEYANRSWRLHTEELMHPHTLIENVRRALQLLDVEVGQAGPTACGNFIIHLPIQVDSGHKAAVMVALPHHTTRNEPYRVLGDFRSVLDELEMRRWRCVPLMWHEWGREDADEAQQRAYLTHQIESTLKVKLGLHSSL